jgi:hypothetical protein
VKFSPLWFLLLPSFPVHSLYFSFIIIWTVILNSCDDDPISAYVSMIIPVSVMAPAALSIFTNKNQKLIYCLIPEHHL